MDSRPTLSLTGFGSEPRRFAARLAAEARSLACGSAFAAACGAASRRRKPQLSAILSS